MAVTVLMHMKEEKEFPAAHLYNTINYVLDVKNDGKKTDYGKWVGGNAGREAGDVFHNFMETKKFWEKEHGRQGYHFVISFAEGEADEQMCYDVAKEFCEKFLGDNYDYVFAVHNDKNHKHAHIVFNSLSRTTGYKYHYKNGDWKKDIQPITDEICKAHGLPALTFTEKTTGVPYAEWSAQKNGTIRWSDIMRADIDLAIAHASSIDEFYSFMEKMHYTVEEGKSEKHGPFFHFRYTDENGKVHKIRSYNKSLGENYSPYRISVRIQNKEKEQAYYTELSQRLADKVNVRLGSNASMIKNTKVYYRTYQAVSYYKLPNPFAVTSNQVRKDMIRIDRLIEECRYLKQTPKHSYQDLNIRKEEVDEKLHQLYIERKHLREIESDIKIVVPDSTLNRYRQLKRQISEAEERDDHIEAAMDELEELEDALPFAVVENERKLLRCENSIEVLKKEKRILERIIKTEGGIGRNEEIEKNTKVKMKL